MCLRICIAYSNTPTQPQSQHSSWRSDFSLIETYADQSLRCWGRTIYHWLNQYRFKPSTAMVNNNDGSDIGELAISQNLKYRSNERNTSPRNVLSHAETLHGKQGLKHGVWWLWPNFYCIDQLYKACADYTVQCTNIILCNIDASLTSVHFYSYHCRKCSFWTTVANFRATFIISCLVSAIIADNFLEQYNLTIWI